MKDPQLNQFMRLTIIMLMTLGLSENNLIAQSSEKLFQDALMMEEAEGDLEKAIDMYYQITDDVSANRLLRANALMHIGICYEKMGWNNATNTYKLLISEYPDQYEVVAAAKEKLRSLESSKQGVKDKGIVIRYLKTEPKGNRNRLNGISPDGKFYNYINWDEHEIFVCDLTNGETDSVTYGNTLFAREWSNPVNAIWSMDGSSIAYIWNAEGVQEIRTIKPNGDDRKTVTGGESGSMPNIYTFTPDNKGLIGILSEQVDDKANFKLTLISISLGSIEILKDFGEQEVKKISFSSDGKYLLYTKEQKNSTNSDIFIMSYPDLDEVLLIDDPGNDHSPVWSMDGSEILFFSQRFGSNDLYKIKIRNGKKYSDEVVLKKNVGKRIKVMGVDKNNALYYATDNSRSDVYTMDLDKAFNENKLRLERVTDFGMRSGGLAARYSTDGRHISYLSYESNYHDYQKNPDKNLGNKFFLGIYDTETKMHRELDVDLYENHFWGDMYIPQWSHDGEKLLVHGVKQENYEGGFYTVDVNTSE